MRSFGFYLVFFAAGAALFGSEIGPYTFQDNAWYVESNGHKFKVNEDELVLKFKGDVSLEQQNLLLEEFGFEVIRSNRLGYLHLKAPKGALSFETAKMAAKHQWVEHANAVAMGAYCTNDPHFSKQWGFHNTGAGGGIPDADVDAVEAWNITTGDPNLIVAALDSGLDYHHNDLGPNLWQNLGEDADKDGHTLYHNGTEWVFDPGDINGIDDDGNGAKDDLAGWNIEKNTHDISEHFSFWHGTHVAGTFGARTNNSKHVAGLAGGWDQQRGVQVMLVKLGLSPTSANLANAIIYAVDNGARIITLSLYMPKTPGLDAAFDYAFAKGVLVDCASGNFSSSVTYPASYPTVMAVGSSNKKDKISSYSNFGPEIEVAAPGEDIWSTSPNQGQASADGTSMAAPHVAGVAALILSVAPSLTGEEVRMLIRNTADDKGAPGWDKYFGYGRINAFEAVKAASAGFTLKADTYSMSSKAGGSVNFTLDAGASHLNRNYYLLASISGTDPGTPLGSVVLPLNWDQLTNISISLANSAIFTNTFNTLDSSGQGGASFNVNANDLRPIVGQKISFAYFLYPPADMASNAVKINVSN